LLGPLVGILKSSDVDAEQCSRTTAQISRHKRTVTGAAHQDDGKHKRIKGSRHEFGKKTQGPGGCRWSRGRKKGKKNLWD